MARRPCNADLLDAAAILRGEKALSDDHTIGARVGAWLDSVGREATDRQRARAIGCTVRYLKRVVDREARQ